MLRQSLFKKIATLLPLLTLLAAGQVGSQQMDGQNVDSQSAQPISAAGATTAPMLDTSAPPATGGDSFKSLDEEVQSLKKEVLDLNRELFVLEEELLFPANTQVAVFVSMDVGEFFALDSVTLKLDNKEVANYLYTEREAQALLKGGVHRVFIGNLKAGEHELIALFTGQGPNARDYRRGATVKLQKGVGAKYVELKISDRAVKAQPEFIVKEWE
ncbi:AraC family transcriptional regulator [Steroidobacter sp. S1-65]|uniref:AraC family transcriptional regulator n=1 Tax=Steroidobacter gossypii TaxID=2805490 RepID=A0ABS1X271_9GAMM|nr:AraC family transcriptional regulator [Steroidobacter gossypii]MBM0107323.1 AraC family transcriptional regulator [Steroidobacter gossypii]